MSALRGTLKNALRWQSRDNPTWHPTKKGKPTMKTVMGWIDKIVSSLAKRKVNKNEGRSNPR